MNYYNPYSNQNYQYFQPNYQSYQPQTYTNQQYNQPINQPIKSTLQGKQVDSVDVVRAMDIPLDGTISYFPLADNSAIVTKQLMNDGTSRTIIYKPFNNDNVNVTSIANEDYVTNEVFQNAMQDITNLKKQVEELKKNIDKKEGKK